MTGEANRLDEMEAKIFMMQSLEWMKDCPHKHRCPAARFFTHLTAAHQKIDRLEKCITKLKANTNGI